MHVVNFDLPSKNYGGIDEYIHRIGKNAYPELPRYPTDYQTGRTARIGNEGLATSFYNHDKDKDIAPDLVKILMECNQPIPDFLEDEKPTDGVLRFDDDTDNEGENNDTAGGDAWGGGSLGPEASNANGSQNASVPAAAEADTPAQSGDAAWSSGAAW